MTRAAGGAVGATARRSKYDSLGADVGVGWLTLTLLLHGALNKAACTPRNNKVTMKNAKRRRIV